MNDIIKIIVDADHYLRCPVDTIARDGEGNVTELEITFPEKLASYWVYLDFKMSNGEKLKTPRLDVEGNTATYRVPPYLLREGQLKMQVLFQNDDGAIWKSYKRAFNVRRSINAVDDIPDKEDFITEAQKVLDEIHAQGGGVLTVDFQKDTASHTAKQIYDHVVNGGTAVLWRRNSVTGDEYFVLEDVWPSSATFSSAFRRDGWFYSYVIVGEDGSANWFDLNFINPDMLEDEIGCIDITQLQNWTEQQKETARSNIGVTEITADDKLDANSTKPVQNKVVAAEFANVREWQSGAFGAINSASAAANAASEMAKTAGEIAHHAKQTIEYDIDPRLTKAEADIATLKENCGDIDTALDSIIAIQQSLIGGDA